VKTTKIQNNAKTAVVMIANQVLHSPINARGLIE
jgi:hypothetical protein